MRCTPDGSSMVGGSTELRIVVMGVAGSGKSTVARALAAAVGAVFLAADDFPPDSTLAKMASGVPLGDDERWPWLVRLRFELRAHDRVVLACSALRRSYRDLLRGADGVQFLFLDIDPSEASARAAEREGHFMSASMIESQFSTLERPDGEQGVVVVDASAPADTIAAAAGDVFLTDVARSRPWPLIAEGGTDAELDGTPLAMIVDRILALVQSRGAQRVLLVPPDHTRLHSRAGEITVRLRNQLLALGREVAVLPALGTHAAMGPLEATALFGGALPADELLHHDWRDGVISVGELGADEVEATTGGRFRGAIEVAVDRQLFDGWDLVVSIGQVVPHEVIGMANFTKNLVIGLGGAPTIHRTHFVGAVYG
ncbi:MAG: gluconokinase, GntK/IdnK-type, partial [Actinomycetes bacterium]